MGSPMLATHFPSFKVRTDEMQKHLTRLRWTRVTKVSSSLMCLCPNQKNNDSLISESEIPLNPYPHNSPIKTFNTDNLKRYFLESVPKSILSNRG